MDHVCDCPLKGVCKKHGIAKSAREKEICRGENVLPAVRDAYLKKWESSLDRPQTVVKSVASLSVKPRGLPGTELKKLISWFGFKGDNGCGCSEHAAKMDHLGPQWCKDNIDTIVGWMVESAKKKSVLGFAVSAIPGMVGMTAEALVRKAIANAERFEESFSRGSPFQYKGQCPRFISTSRFVSDIHRLSSMIPAETSAIIGIARSGLTPATIVSQLLHLPLMAMSQENKTGGSPYSISHVGSGWRLSGNTGGDGPPVLIDDTVMSGNSFRHCLPVVRGLFPEVRTAAVYVNPKSRFKPDFWVEDLPWPHFLEWNMFNSVMTPSMAFDFDGILCHECPGGSDDDGLAYLEFLRNVRPLYPVRKIVIPMIATARLEKYRSETLAWLSRNGMAVRELVMGPWGNNSQRTFSKVVSHKASAYRRFMLESRGVKPPAFVESDDIQARKIAELSGGIVICPATNGVYCGDNQ